MKDEFVMVPRTELARLQENMDPHRGAVAWGIVCDLLAKAAEQHRGEPVAWVRDDGDRCLEFTSPGYGIGYPVYRHADPGEVDRLRGIIRMHEKTVREQADHLAYMRTRLAERDALLEDWHAANCTGEVNVSDKAYRIVTRTAAMLADNTEPSVPVDRDARSDIAADAAYRNGVMHGHKLAMEGNEADYQACINSLTEHLRAARAASAEPSAPAECDESGLNAERYLFLRNMGVDRSPGRERCLSVSVEDWADNLAPPPAGVATCGAWSSMELRGEELDREVDAARAALGHKS